MNGSVEFYLGHEAKAPMLTMKTNFIPAVGEFINIRKVTYEVTFRSFTVDHADNYAERTMRCNITLRKV